MSATMRGAACVGLMIISAALMSSARASDEALAAKIRGELQATLDAALAASATVPDPIERARMLYTDDVTIAGERIPEATRGLAAAAADVANVRADLGPGSECGPVVISEPLIVTPTTASSFMSMKCATPNSATHAGTTNLRMLYVWKKLPQGWRCVLEYWGVGVYPN